MNAEVRVVPHVYQAIAKVQGLLAKNGISKDRKNQQQGYSFRGIDDIYNALSSHLSEVGLCILPAVLTREATERPTQKGGVMFYVVVQVDFAFVSAEDGSAHHIITFGEAMDSADKATNKAMSAAYKYACLQAFCIPTEGDNDADAHTPELAGHITQSQVADLDALIVEVGASLTEFLKFFKITALAEMPSSKFDRACGMLRKKGKKA